MQSWHLHWASSGLDVILSGILSCFLEIVSVSWVLLAPWYSCDKCDMCLCLFD